jgi:hypothetical protein
MILDKELIRTQISKYDIAIRVKACNLHLLELLEPYCNRIFIEDTMQVLFTHYFDAEQSNTKFDLKTRINTQGYDDPHDYHDIVVEIDRNSFTQQDFSYIHQLAEIIQSSGEIGTFRLGNLTVTIHQLESYEKTLINL